MYETSKKKMFFLLASGLRSSAGTTRVTLKEPLLTCARCVPHGKGQQRSCLCHTALGFSHFFTVETQMEEMLRTL